MSTICYNGSSEDIMIPYLPSLLLFATTTKRLLNPAIYFQHVQLHRYPRNFCSPIVLRFGGQSLRRLLCVLAKHSHRTIFSTRSTSLECTLFGRSFHTEVFANKQGWLHIERSLLLQRDLGAVFLLQRYPILRQP